MTSVNKMPRRPEVAGYLHGLTNDPPTTYVAWRKELSLFSENGIDDERTLQEWFAACPVRANERMPMSTYELRTELRKLTSTHEKNKTGQEILAALLDERNQVEWFPLSRVGERDAGMEYKTIVCPQKQVALDNSEHSIQQYWNLPLTLPTRTLKEASERVGYTDQENVSHLFLRRSLVAHGRSVNACC